MSKRLYVGNLSYKADEEALKEIFGEVGDANPEQRRVADL